MSNSQHKISVALCTYNGEPFLPQQLSSIQQQTRLPDELVVCDDRSTDQTLALLREFAATVSFPVTIVQNPETLGFAKNFEKAIQLCAGELIALSDQDDIWYPHRLQRSEQEFVAYPQAGLVFSDADVIDEQNRLLGQTLWQRLGFAGKPRHDLLAGRLVVLAKHRFVTGATVMFRANLRDRFLPVGAGWIHDEWIALVVAAFSDPEANRRAADLLSHPWLAAGRISKQAGATGPGKYSCGETLEPCRRVGQGTPTNM